QLVDAWEPEWVVGIGAFATRRAAEALDTDSIQIGTVLHPSPANPRANRGWAGEAGRQLSELGLCGDPRGKGQ
ncbi:MAG: single-stranded DNA-binding protein, partial [Myxococcota bacterium]|nr:single-stranded DNA-binding protein [Myxococcota bacterium]